MALLAAIRMKGRFSLSPSARATLDSLRLRKLYSCTLLSDSDSAKGMLQAAKDAISFGPISREAAVFLLRRRGRTLDGRRLSEAKSQEEIEKLADALLAGKSPHELGISASFALSPPKGGFGSRKKAFPGGPLGRNEKIGELIMKMA
ncbi:MAG: uL30 family ribosomal protein [Candidatus Micrarchaeota archaeon]|nr:uL30 family ribosomal protein [Candidatus Micrarchaeota archaeon]